MRARYRGAARARLIGGLALAAVAAGCEDRLAPPGSQLPELAGGPVPAFHRAAAGVSLRLTSPVRLASRPNGTLLVSDYFGQAVLRLDSATLQPVGGFRARARPVALGVAGGHLFVGNPDERTVDVFGPNGRWRYSFGRGAVRDPVDLEADLGRGLVFVVDGLGRAVRVFDFQGVPQGTLAGFRHPTGIALDTARQEVLVSDYGDAAAGEEASLKILDYRGGLLARISGRGACGMLGCTGGFSRPQGVALDGAGRIYLVDCLLGQVLVFDRTTLARVGALGTFGPGPGQLLLPQDVVLGPGGRVWVANYQGRRVERYRLEGQP